MLLLVTKNMDTVLTANITLKEINVKDVVQDSKEMPEEEHLMIAVLSPLSLLVIATTTVLEVVTATVDVFFANTTPKDIIANPARKVSTEMLPRELHLTALLVLVLELVNATLLQMAPSNAETAQLDILETVVTNVLRDTPFHRRLAEETVNPLDVLNPIVSNSSTIPQLISVSRSIHQSTCLSSRTAEPSGPVWLLESRNT